MQRFKCDCGNRLYFENTDCLACGREVSWCPVCATLTAMEFADPGASCARCGTELWKCANRVEHHVCNRSLVAPADPGSIAGPLYCDCCRYNDTIPDLSIEGNLERWRELEQAKRRLIHNLDMLGLPHGARADGLEPGLSFDFKSDVEKPPTFWRTAGDDEVVFTGHDGGKITINTREADAAEREKLRVDLGESHRTLIGHFRHEIGHYYWDLLIKGDPDREARFASVFGDPQAPSYKEALERHYRDGPPDGWKGNFISAYATMHPWEDWAETFSFYLEINDVMETAAAARLVSSPVTEELSVTLETYVSLGMVVNELNRTIGLLDFLPEVIAPPIAEKLHAVHDVVAPFRPAPA